MELAITYTNNRGESMVFGGSQEELNIFENDLRDAAWEYTASGNAIAYFSRPQAEIDLKVGIAADTEEEGLELRDRLADITEADVIDNEPGKISVNGWYLPCYVIEREAGEWWRSGRFFECTLKLLAMRREWSLRHTLHIDPNTSDGSAGDLDFEFDYPHDYHTGNLGGRTVENPGIDDSDLIIRVYGACKNPKVTVAGNAYGATVDVEEGGYLEVDTEKKTCELVGTYGDRTNAFAQRLAGGEGSGSYIFEKMPRGVQAVSADASLSYDVVVVEHRSEPRWVREGSAE